MARVVYRFNDELVNKALAGECRFAFVFPAIDAEAGAVQLGPFPTHHAQIYIAVPSRNEVDLKKEMENMATVEHPLRVTVWNEFVHEKDNEVVSSIYPDGIHGAIAAGLKSQLAAQGVKAVVRTATLDQPEHGLTEDVLAETDVLYWWGHRAHDDVQDAIVDRVQAAVLRGMGLVVLHSGHASKIFRRLMGTGCMLRWRVADERERLWVVSPGHPITQGIKNSQGEEDEHFELPAAEMYGEFFDIPQPDEVVFISWFEGGEVFRSGCTFQRGQGKIFYFRPGHETYPIYHNETVQLVLANAARWAAASPSVYVAEARNIDKPLEEIG